MERKKDKKRSKSVSEKDNKILRQGTDFVKALKKANLPAYIDVSTNPNKVFWFSFLRGTGFGLGTLLGASVLFTLFAHLYRILEKMPILGEIFSDAGNFFGW